MIEFKKNLMKRILVFVIAIFALFSLFACDAPDSNIDDVGNSGNEESYDISNEYFVLETYEPTVGTTVNLQSGGTAQKYLITCKARCFVSLYEYRAVVKLYSSANEILDAQIVEKSNKIDANKEFSFDLEVSKQIQSETASVVVTFTGKSYEKPDTISNENPVQSAKKYQVVFVYNNGTNNSKVLVKEGETVSTPTDPQKSNHLFCGWYQNASLTKKYDFSKPVTENLTLYAKYELDALSLTNTITTDTIRGVVKVYNKSYNTFLGIETSSETSQGSGFCFGEQDGYYYILTNCHVAKKKSGYDKQKITIEDYQGNIYEGTIYRGASKSEVAIDPAYDLACIWIKPSSTNIKALTLSKENLEMGEAVIAVGAPKGQSNSIAYGSAITYKTITLENTSPAESNVTFKVLRHNAYSNNGSSGGPVLSADLKVVGVQYAGSAEGNSGYAIPAEKVYEFLKKYVYI